MDNLSLKSVTKDDLTELRRDIRQEEVAEKSSLCRGKRVELDMKNRVVKVGGEIAFQQSPNETAGSEVAIGALGGHAHRSPVWWRWRPGLQ